MDARKSAVPQKASAAGIEEGGVVQQLMFNRILAALRLLWVDRVAVTGFDPTAGTIEGRLAGVNFVVNVSVLSKTRAHCEADRAIAQGRWCR